MSEVPQYHVRIVVITTNEVLFDGWLPSIPGLGDHWERENDDFEIVARWWNSDLTVCRLSVEAV